jgi:hypothetical protein
MLNNSNRARLNKNLKKNIPRNTPITNNFQSYDLLTLGNVQKTCSQNKCTNIRTCCRNQYKFQQYVQAQQDLYARMRRFPEQFPLIGFQKIDGLTPAQQRQYSNNWYRQFGTSQALPVNDNWGGFYLVGSEVPYTN